ncbi:MAG TPA: VOC family protein [Sandaracinaceae bacterium LLY-WYZ-13_1]|nr:VOC family protein [Sandaracinaceae bacterium LLY-WYZ-13_1]
MSDIDPIPPGLRLISYLAVRDAEAALAFYADVLGASVITKIPMGDGRLGHAELALPGDARLFLSDEFPEMNVAGPAALGGTPVSLMLYVEDVDATAARAVEKGAELQGAIEDQIHGDRTARLVDPFGHRWFLSSRIEEVGPEEIERRYAAQAGGS